MILGSIEQLGFPSFHYDAPYLIMAVQAIPLIVKAMWPKRDSDQTKVKLEKQSRQEREKLKQQTTADGAKYSHFIWGTFSTPLSSRNVVLYMRAVIGLGLPVLSGECGCYSLMLFLV